MTESDYPSSAPVGVDTTRASIARVYDAFLNGKDNFEVDREVLARVQTVAPQATDLAWANRDFLIRVCRFLVRNAGIDQFLDLGSGLPTAENTHQVVQRVNPDARVVYVDNDPMVLAHGRALLAENNRATISTCDIFQPLEVLKDASVLELGFHPADRPAADRDAAPLPRRGLGRADADLHRRTPVRIVRGDLAFLRPTRSGGARAQRTGREDGGQVHP